MRKRMRTVLGLLLIATSVALMVYWETGGRDRVMTVPLIVTSKQIYQGEIVTRESFQEKRISEEGKVTGALPPEELKEIIGKRALHSIPANSQIIRENFSERQPFLEGNQGIFLVKKEWIFSVSSSLRKGDFIEIYAMDGATSLGMFRVAFAKDEQGRELVEVEMDAYKGREYPVLERIHTSGRVDHIEIVADIGQYRSLLDYIFPDEDIQRDREDPTDITPRKVIIHQRQQNLSWEGLKEKEGTL